MKIDEIEMIRERYSDFIGRNKYYGLVAFNKIPETFYEGEGLWGWRE